MVGIRIVDMQLSATMQRDQRRSVTVTRNQGETAMPTTSAEA